MKPILVLLFTLTALQAQTGPAGHWEGVIKTPAKEIPIQVDLANDPAGQLYGTFSSQAQHMDGFPLGELGTKGKDIYFQLKGTPGNRAFLGSLSADEKTMSGEFKQGPYSLPFLLTRAGAPQIAPAVKTVPISKELEGQWSATAEISGEQLKFVLTMANQAGGSTGSIHSLADDLDIPISAIKEVASKVMLDLRSMGGSYTGELRSNATELAGTYTQGTTVIPLTFHRAK